ncbi:MAG TPA: hypothetical protein VNE71_01210, partial [Myxococcota bacterium]|nr:hypothetical protein [Myxococcota bacterium]
MASEGPERRGPYPGLVPYGEEDAGYFFGREGARRAVIDNLVAYRITVLYGPSGVGKSSLLRAGVVHDLREAARRHAEEGRPPEHAVVVFGSWTADPLAGLIGAIREVVPAAEVPGDSLTAAITAAAEHLGAPLLIILDQFEEYFLYHPRGEALGSFDAELARAVARRDIPANFLISIREDALAGLDRFDERIPGLLDNLFRVDHLDRAAAGDAIERPLGVWSELGAGGPTRAEPGLVEALLDQEHSLRAREEGVGTADRIRTPYLQLVLARLWAEEAKTGSEVLRLSTLEALGGAERIVATHLDEAMATLTPREQRVAVRIFRHLVTPSGMKIAQQSADLAEYAAVPEPAVAAVLERLTDARILQALGDSRYEIYHDALAEPILEWRRRWVRRHARRQAQLRLIATVGLAAVVLAALAFAGSLGDLELST